MINPLPKVFESFCTSTTKINEIISVLNFLTEPAEGVEDTFDETCSVGTHCLVDHTVQDTVQDEWPKKKQDYWYIHDSGCVIGSWWTDSESERDRRDFMGIYKDRESAEAALERIKELLKKV